MTQEKLAEHAGLSVRALRRLESGASLVPRRDTIDLLATALKLAPEKRTLLEVNMSRFRGVEKESGDILHESKGGRGYGRERIPVPRTSFLQS